MEGALSTPSSRTLIRVCRYLLSHSIQTTLTLLLSGGECKQNIVRILDSYDFRQLELCYFRRISWFMLEMCASSAAGTTRRFTWCIHSAWRSCFRCILASSRTGSRPSAFCVHWREKVSGRRLVLGSVFITSLLCHHRVTRSCHLWMLLVNCSQMTWCSLSQTPEQWRCGQWQEMKEK